MGFSVRMSRWSDMDDLSAVKAIAPVDAAWWAVAERAEPARGGFSGPYDSEESYALAQVSDLDLAWRDWFDREPQVFHVVPFALPQSWVVLDLEDGGKLFLAEPGMLRFPRRGAGPVRDELHRLVLDAEARRLPVSVYW